MTTQAQTAIRYALTTLYMVAKNLGSHDTSECACDEGLTDACPFCAAAEVEIAIAKLKAALS